MTTFPLPRILVATWWFAAVLCGAHRQGGEGPSITCDCSTAQCEQQKTSVCTTEGLCFTQYLDRGLDRNPSLLRGCTEGRTPLLCENRKPSRAKMWPLLHCCGTNFCNRDAMPTPPLRHGAERHAGDGHSFKTLEIQKVASSFAEGGHPPPPLLSPSAQGSRRPWPRIVSAVYISILALGVVSLVVIGIVAATVIRRSNGSRRFCADPHYDTLEFRRRKEALEHCDCDSEIESVGSFQPYLHTVCPDRDT